MGKNARGIILINMPFQFKVAGLAAGLILLICGMFALSTFQLIESLKLKVDPSKITELESFSNDVLWLFGGFSLLYAAAVFVGFLLVTHRIAGPIYKVGRFMRDFSLAQEVRQLHFRKGDYFPELAESFNQMTSQVHQSYQETFAELEEVRAYMNNLAVALPSDKRPVLEELDGQLMEIQSRYQA